MKEKRNLLNMSEIRTELNGMALRSLMSYRSARETGDSNFNNSDIGIEDYAVEQVNQGRKREAEQNEQMAQDVKKILVLLNLLSEMIEELIESTEDQENRLLSVEMKFKKVKKKVKKQGKQQSVQEKNITAILMKQKEHNKDLKAVRGCLSIIGVAMGISNFGSSPKSIKKNMEQHLSLSYHERPKKIPKAKYEDLGEI